MSRFMIDIPSWDFGEGEASPNFEIGPFNSREEAIAFAIEKLGADSQGRLDLITEINCDPEGEQDED